MILNAAGAGETGGGTRAGQRWEGQGRAEEGSKRLRWAGRWADGGQARAGRPHCRAEESTATNC